MRSTSLPYCFQAAVELPLSLAVQNSDGKLECRDYCVTVVAERPGLSELDVVLDFRALDAALAAVLLPMDGKPLNELGINGLADAVKIIAVAIAPALAEPVKLAAVSIRDGAGRQITLKQ